MIAQLQKSLIQRNSTFEKKKKGIEEDVAAEISLKDRLALLSNSAEQWKTRPVRQPPPPLQQRRTSANVLQDLPIFQRAHALQNNNRQSLPILEKPCDITSGLKKFFNQPPPAKTETTTNGVMTEIDLDAITLKAAPILKSITRPRAPNRKRAVKSENLDDRTHLNTVHLNEDAFIVPEEEPEKLETQEQAIAAIKGAKQLLKTPSRVSPYPEIMLIQIRGSKNVDVRLVAPAMSSIHEGACFILVAQSSLMKYEGDCSNILEKTKCSQICIEIQGKSDLNCSADTVVTVKEKTQMARLLYSSENDDENFNRQQTSLEPYESIISKLNLVLRITSENTIETFSRRERLSYSILQPNDVFIFDFGSEIYVWSGRNSNKVSTAYAIEYAKQLMKKEVKNGKSWLGETESGGDGRPEWTLFRKIHQGVLDTLFKSKFSDWPETREVLTTCKPRPLFTKSKNPEVKTYEDVKIANQDDDVISLVERMLQEPESDPILILEDQEIDRKMCDVISEDRALWILKGEHLERIDFSWKFDSQKCYVFRWKYRIQKSGIRRIRTGKEEERETGRSRIAFFYWLGEATTPKQHGLCALRIKEIDRDNSPRIRVADGNEPALFLALFEGKFMVSHGSSASSPEEPLRRYVITGANLQESSLREVSSLSSAPLRSHAAYIEVSKAGPSIVCGANCAPEQVHFVLSHAQTLGAVQPEVEVEGDKPTRRWINSSGRKRAMRMWRIFENEAEKTNHLGGHKDCAFTFSQQILSETILIDVGEALWLWSEEVVTTFAIKVASLYWKSRSGPSKVVYKGAEPDEFKALFMKWDDFEMDSEATRHTRDVTELLRERCRTFSLKELKERINLPAGMDMRRLESYLTDDDFSKTFGTSRSEFYTQKAWKQNEARKRVGLF